MSRRMRHAIGQGAQSHALAAGARRGAVLRCALLRCAVVLSLLITPTGQADAAGHQQRKRERAGHATHVPKASRYRKPATGEGGAAYIYEHVLRARPGEGAVRLQPLVVHLRGAARHARLMAGGHP
jgi:hypothetical protein